MNRNQFLSSISASVLSLGSSLATIASSISAHPATGDSDFDPDGTLAAAASQLNALAETARSTADSLNPATPGGVNDVSDATGAGGAGSDVQGNDSSAPFANPDGNQTSDATLPADATVPDTSGDTVPVSGDNPDTAIPDGASNAQPDSQPADGGSLGQGDPGGGDATNTPV